MHNSAYLERPDPTLCRVKRLRQTGRSPSNWTVRSYVGMAIQGECHIGHPYEVTSLMQLISWGGGGGGGGASTVEPQEHLLHLSSLFFIYKGPD